MHQRLISQHSQVPSAPQKLPQQPDNELPCHSCQADTTWDGCRSWARQGERRYLNGAKLCGSVSAQSQAVHVHPAVKEQMETAFLNQFQLATTHLPLKLSFPKVWKTWDKKKTGASIQGLLHSWEQVKCRNQGESSS